VSTTSDGRVYTCEMSEAREGEESTPQLVLSASRTYENAVVQMNTATDFGFASAQYGEYDSKQREQIDDNDVGRLSQLANHQRERLKRYLCPSQPQTTGFSDPDAAAQFRPMSRPGTVPGTPAHALLEGFNSESHRREMVNVRGQLESLIKQEEKRMKDFNLHH
jgi:hypothetical protein